MWKHLGSKHLKVLASLVLISVPSAANAIVPATPEEILCISTYVVVAEVLSGKLTDCRLRYPDARSCSPENLLHFSIRVDEVLASKAKDLSKAHRHAPRRGDLLQVNTEVYNEIPRYVARVEIQGPLDEDGRLKVEPPTGRPLADQEILDQFVGKSFIFGIDVDTNSTRVWPISLGKWVDETLRRMNGPPCPKPLSASNP